MSRIPLRVVLLRARIDIATRAFSLLAGFVLAAITLSTETSAPTSLLLIAIATVMSWWATRAGWLNQTYLWFLPVEAAAATLIVTWTVPDGDAYLTYLAIPPLLAGLRAGLAPMVVAVVAECATTAVMYLLAESSYDERVILELVGPWIATGFGLGLLGAWIRQLRLGPAAQRRTPYASAHRLLAQLRGVSRELSSGLDRDTVTSSLLNETLRYFGGTRAALVRPSVSGGLRVVAHTGEGRFGDHLLSDPSVSIALRSHQYDQRPREGVDPAHRYRFVLPLAIGSRSIGVVVMDGPKQAHPETLDQVRDLLEEQALRLESSELFEDVRKLATVEERNRLAREIHDGIAQEVASLGYVVDDLASKDCNRDHRAGLMSLRDDLTRLVSDLRMSIFDLRSEEASNGLGAVLGDYVREVATSSGIAVHLSLEESRDRLKVEVETELLRIAQEAVTNARKHSRALNLWVSCRVEPPFAEVRVEDDGVGGTADRHEHYGLQIMRERAARINAVLSITERAGGGTVVSAVLLPADNATIPPSTGENHVLQRAARR